MRRRSVRPNLSPLILHTVVLLFMALNSLPAHASAAVGPMAQGTAPTPPVVFALGLPLLVDGEDGRLYGTMFANGQADHIAVFSARDGRPITTFRFGKPFGLDAEGNRLFVISGRDQITILDARTGKELRKLQVKLRSSSAALYAAPQYDAQTGHLLVFGGNAMFVMDPVTGTQLGSTGFDVPVQDRCRMPSTEPLPIERSFFDGERRLVYLVFLSYVCTPWAGYTIVAYDLAKGAEIGRLGTETPIALAAGGGLYVESWHRFGIGTIWNARDGKLDHRTAGWSSGSQFQLDSRRTQLYQSGDGSIRMFNPADMTLTGVVPQPVQGQLAAYDPVGDRLYFVDGATVRSWPAAKLSPAPAKLAKAKSLPKEAVRLIVASPAWQQDKTLVGVWSTPWTDTSCYVFNQTYNSGTLLLSQDGGRQWLKGQSGLPSNCGLASALAISPAYAKDRTLLAGIRGHGIFKSTDGGTTWRPSGKGLPHIAVHDLALSPGFATDRTAFASVFENGLQRSVDGGASWHTLHTSNAPVIALSPEFDGDGTLANYGMTAGGGTVQLSEDRGEQWRDLTAPSTGGPRLLSLAPAFKRWGVMFAGDIQGDLYRSADAGQSWQRVLQAGSGDASNPAVDRMQIAYGPDEVRREVFLVVTGLRYESEQRVVWGRLYRSANGGQTWAEINPGNGVVPTALAMPPTFAQDRMLLIGTADGQILTLTP